MPTRTRQRATYPNAWRFVVAVGKRPTAREWQEHPLDQATLRRRLASNSEANPSLLLGPAPLGSGVIDIECDGPVAEEELLELFVGPIPKTVCWQSKRGRHYLFRSDERLRGINKSVVKYGKVEVRIGPGACSTLPPAETDGFKRRWIRKPGSCKVARLPKAVVERILANEHRHEGNGHVRVVADELISNGQRNETLARMAGAMRRQGMGEAAMEAALQEENQSRCRQPLSSGEVASIARSIARYEPSNISSFNSFNSYTPGKWPTLGDAALTGLAGEVVNAIDPYTEAAKAATLAHLLIPFGIMAGDGSHCMVQHDRHPAKENVILVGQSSKGRKGTSWGSLREIHSAVDETWTRNQIVSGLSTGEGIISHLRDDGGCDDKRLLVLEEEFARLLIVMNRPENTLSATMRQFYDTGNLGIHTRNNPMVATGTHVGIIGHITVEELRRRLNSTDTANGFANRFMYFGVDRSKLLPNGATPPPQMMNKLSMHVKKAVTFARQVRVVKRDPAAEELWAAEYESLSEGKPGLLGAVTSRAEVHVLRLSLIYSLLGQSMASRPNTWRPL